MARTPRNDVRTKSGDDGIPKLNLSDKTVIEPDALPQNYNEDTYDESEGAAEPSAPEGIVLTDAPVTHAQLAASQVALTQAITAMIDSQPIKRVTFAKFRTRSPFNPTGNKRRKLSRRCYQNGYPMDIKKLHDEEIAMLNKVTPGKYIRDLITVLQVQTGGNTDLHIIYENKSFDQRLALKSEFRNLKEMLSLVLDEAKQRGPTVVTV